MNHTDTATGARAYARLAARVGAVVALLLAAMALTPTSSGAAPAADKGMATSWVRAAHLVPGLGTVSISLVPFAGAASGAVTKQGVPPATTANGARVVQPAGTYGEASDYRQVPQGLYTVQVRPQGAAPSSTPMLTGTLDAKADQAYTLAVLGTKGAPRVHALSDDLRAPRAGSASVRLLSAATGAADVSVTAQDGRSIAKDVAFARPTGYAAVPAGTWSLTLGAVTGGGTSSGTKPTAQTVSLRSGGVYTLLVLDKAGGGLTLQPLVDAQGMAQMPKQGVNAGEGGMAPLSNGQPGHALAVVASGGTAALLVSLLLTSRRRRTVACPRTHARH